MNGAYEENKLLNRLFGSYRMSFVAGDGCSLDENDGKQLYAESPDQVPLEEYFKYFDSRICRFTEQTFELKSSDGLRVQNRNLPQDSYVTEVSSLICGFSSGG